jgi:hypothetical protein
MDRRTFLGGAIAGSAAAAANRAAASKGEIQQASYVIVELMGYKKLAGRMTQGIAGLLQLDVPVEGGFSTQFINPTSVYRITVVDEEVVKEVSKRIDALPTIELEIQPRQRRLGFDQDDDDTPY